MLKRYRIQAHEVGLHFRDGRFVGLLEAGRYCWFDPFGRNAVDVVSLRAPRLAHAKLDLIVKSGLLGERAVAIDLKDHERGLVWIDGRFAEVLRPGLHVFWTELRSVRVETVDARAARFAHDELATILKADKVTRTLLVVPVAPTALGVWFRDGQLVDTLTPGTHAFWLDAADVHFEIVDLRETTLELAGQEIMTSDKVTLRLNAQLTYKIVDVRLATMAVADVNAALYREAQLGLRAIVGGRDLDAFLGDKEQVARDLEASLRTRAAALGVEIASAGVRDVILPGEMKDLFNKVTEAKKAAEANLISRREETAAIRSQANTAKILQDNPMLLRLRELETLERVATTSKLNIVVGEKGLADRVVNVL